MSVAWAGLVRLEAEEESSSSISGRTLDSLPRVDLVDAATNLVNQVMDGLNIPPASSYLFTETHTVHTVVKARATRYITCAKYVSSDDCVRSDDPTATLADPTATPDDPTTATAATTAATTVTTAIPVNRVDTISATTTIAGITATTTPALPEDTTDNPSPLIMTSLDELESARASNAETPGLDADDAVTTQAPVVAEGRAVSAPGLVTMVTHTYTSTIFTTTISSVVSSLTFSYLGCSAPTVSSSFPVCKLTKSTTVAELV
nr:uncharacterized protein LOC123756487 [Procambarus clarkii]